MGTTANGGNTADIQFGSLKQIYDVFFTNKSFKSSNDVRRAIQEIGRAHV